MKPGRNLNDLAQELQRQARANRDFIAPTDLLTMTSGATLVGIDHEEFPLTEWAHQQVAADLDIPKVYYDRMRREQPALLAQNVNAWFRAELRRRMIRTLDQRVRAWVSDRYRPLDNYDLAETVLPVLSELGVEVRSAELTETRLYLKASLPSLRAEVTTRQVGEIVEAGIVIRNSEVGNGAVGVDPFLLILRCMNGATFNKAGLKRYHIGRRIEEGEGVHALLTSEARRADDRAFFLKVRDVVRGSFNRDVFEEIVAMANGAAQQKIEGDPVEVVEVTAKRFNLTETSRQSVLRYLIDGGDLSRWGLSNAVTRASQDVEDYEEATAMERAGGAILELPPPDWKVLSEVA